MGCERKGYEADLLQMFCKKIFSSQPVLAWPPAVGHLDKDKQGALGLFITEQILYFNPIKHHIHFQYNCRGWGLGVGHYLQKISSGWPYIMFLPCQILTNLCDFTILFRAWSKIQSSISNQVLHSTLKTWREKLPKKMQSGCVLLKVYFLGGTS